jgi:hypothetical protein
VAGQHAGYWGELRDAGGTKLFFVAFPDVVEHEAPPPPGGGEFSHVTADRCEAKIMTAHVPNDASATDSACPLGGLMMDGLSVARLDDWLLLAGDAYFTTPR